MSEVICADEGCQKPIAIDGTGHPFKKVVLGKDGGRETLFFCSAEHLKVDERPDLNAPASLEKESA